MIPTAVGDARSIRVLPEPAVRPDAGTASGCFPVTSSVLSSPAILAEVLPAYDVEATACRLLSRGMNDTYDVRTAGARYVIRAYRVGRTVPEVLYELDALLHLHARGIPVAPPVARRDGALVATVTAPEGERHLVLFPFIAGKPLTPDDVAAYGGLVARIHAASDDFASRHPRFELDLRHLVDEPLEAIRPHLDGRAEDWEYLAALARRLRERLRDLPVERLDRGLCHGDINWSNVHVGADRAPAMLDFDCCGTGWRAYDVAIFRWLARTRDAEQTLWADFLRGYEAVRPLAEIELRATDVFVALRHLWAMGNNVLTGENRGIAHMNFGRALSTLRRWDADYLGP
ncbi:MAG TPA: phosphotransferase [Longimicrobium sp.]|nr:phosphotransferase [Longimicrobium sp.]